jgi:hypothetical protein
MSKKSRRHRAIRDTTVPIWLVDTHLYASRTALAGLESGFVHDHAGTNEVLYHEEDGLRCRANVSFRWSTKGVVEVTRGDRVALFDVEVDRWLKCVSQFRISWVEKSRPCDVSLFQKVLGNNRSSGNVGCLCSHQHTVLLLSLGHRFHFFSFLP